MESHRRSIAKALSWRLIAALITALIAYLFTKEATLAVGIGLADSGIKLLVYYSHERLWNRIGFGRTKEVEEDYTI